MEFNPGPNKQATELLFSYVRQIVQTIQVSYLIGTVVPKVKEQKHFGLLLDSTLSFERHLNEKIKKAK